jgi:hypothetical protein
MPPWKIDLGQEGGFSPALVLRLPFPKGHDHQTPFHLRHRAQQLGLRLLLPLQLGQFHLELLQSRPGPKIRHHVHGQLSKFLCP